MLEAQILSGKNNLPVPTPKKDIFPVLLGKGKNIIGYITHLSQSAGDFSNVLDDGFYIDPSELAPLIFPKPFFSRGENLRYRNRFDTKEAAMTAFLNGFKNFDLRQL